MQSGCPLYPKIFFRRFENSCGQQVAYLERLSETAATLDARVPGCPAKVDGSRVMRKVFARPFILTEATITLLKWSVSILF